jgi:1-acyl-sn-glycerol-3-phosphate acyltransferase
MLIGVIFVLSVGAAMALCAGTGAFANLHWLWLLPAGCLGSFLLLAAIVFGIFVLICARIDPEKQRDEDSPWFRWFVMELVHAAVTVLPVQVRLTGREKLPKDGRFLLVSNHLDNIDPAFFYYCFPKSQLAFVGKKETQDMFLVNKVMPKLLCPTINRENDREALKSILRCISLLKNDTVSIAIFPEGRINRYRKLAHFRPGVFKIAQKANVPIVVCTLLGTNHVIGRLLKGKGSAVDVHVLDVIPAESLHDRTTVDIAEQVYNIMAADLGPQNILTAEEEENS